MSAPPGASQWKFDGVGHCVAQKAPAPLLQALEAFETQTAWGPYP
jgi:hypothetical protein